MTRLTVRGITVLIVSLVFLCGPGLVTPVHAADSTADQIQALVKTFYDNNWFSGNVLVKEGDSTIYSGSIGNASIQLNTPNKEETKFLIGSCTKGFTAALALQLAAEGKIKLEATISDYLPYYTSPVGKQVTIHHLLEMSSGIKDYKSVDDGTEQAFLTLMHPWTTQEFITRFCMPETLQFPPGSKYEYVNVNYHILGAIIDAVSSGYIHRLQTKIMDVAGMKNSGILSHEVIIDKFANGYNVIKGEIHPPAFQQPMAAFATGFIYTTAEDFFNWIKALTGNKILSPQYTEMLIKPRFKFPTYGGLFDCMYFAYGWAVQFIDPKTGNPAINCPDNVAGIKPEWIRVLYAGGVYYGFQAVIFHIPVIPASDNVTARKDVYIMVLSNFSTLEWYAAQLGFKIKGFLFTGKTTEL